MTIYEIAAEAKVSISTVSRVMNCPEKVALPTRMRVQEVLSMHNYSPNAMARGLVYNSMKTIGILTSDIRNIHFSIAAYILENYFFNHDYSTLLCNTGDDLSKKKKYIRILAEKKIDGLILLGSVFSDPDIARLLKAYLPETPILISNGNLDLPNVYSVFVDQNYGTELLLDHLSKKGYDNIYFIHSNRSPNTMRKMNGFVKAMKKRDLRLDSNNNILSCQYSIEGAMKFARDFLPKIKNRTTCVFFDDYIACCGVNAFKELGLTIPDDVGVAGFDNSRFALTAYPPLTTVDTKVEEISSIIATTLHNIFMKIPVGNTTTVYPELVIRKST